MCYLWHDNMLMGTTSINQLLSCMSTKHKLSYHLAHVLEHLKEMLSMQWWCVTLTINPRRPTKEHSHEEADALFPPHVILSIQESVLQEEHVWSPDKHKRLDSAHGPGVTRLSQCHDNVDSLHSLWPIDVIWRQGSRSTLAQVMACCLTAPSHYLNQFWFIINKV